MIKTINDIPNNEVGRYLSCAIGVLIKAEEIINGKEHATQDDIIAGLNRAMAGKVAIEAPPACARVDLMVAALEDEIRLLPWDNDYLCQRGLERAIKVIKEFKGVEV
jgi:hypothetical protein